MPLPRFGICNVSLQIPFFVCLNVQNTDFKKLKNVSEPTVLTNCEVQSMRMKMVCDDRTLREVANEFLSLKKLRRFVRER